MRQGIDVCCDGLASSIVDNESEESDVVLREHSRAEELRLAKKGHLIPFKTAFSVLEIMATIYELS
ncbi:hypothetical protein BDW66DRAFT_133866 [Aspergillus desertorum]